MATKQPNLKQTPSPEAALRRLRLFNEKADKLRRSGFVEQVFRPDQGFTISFGDGEPLIVERRGADEQSTDALALTLRFFLNGRDGISLEQMRDLYEYLPLTDDEKIMVRQAFMDHRTMLHEPLGVNFLGSQLTRWMIVETVLYGDLAHANDDKRPALEDWRKAAPFNVLVKSYFEDAVAEVLNLVFGLRQFNDLIIKRLESSSSPE
jgi:hypothetical protein